jgi:hypothetical protein
VPFEVGHNRGEDVGRDSPAVQPVFQLSAAPKADRQKSLCDFDRERSFSPLPKLAFGGVVKDDPRLEMQRRYVVRGKPNGPSAVEDDPLMTGSAVRRVDAHDFHCPLPLRPGP